MTSVKQPSQQAAKQTDVSLIAMTNPLKCEEVMDSEKGTNKAECNAKPLNPMYAISKHDLNQRMKHITLERVKLIVEPRRKQPVESNKQHCT